MKNVPEKTWDVQIIGEDVIVLIWSYKSKVPFHIAHWMPKVFVKVSAIRTAADDGWIWRGIKIAAICESMEFVRPQRREWVLHFHFVSFLWTSWPALNCDSGCSMFWVSIWVENSEISGVLYKYRDPIYFDTFTHHSGNHLLTECITSNTQRYHTERTLPIHEG